ncbi:alpha/beta fold hydrolase [Fibrella aquatica]|uniref:alpha/beta fold hydrolase n=1 Tax=Fibrella aquatica TaxID=3242487 RepID=UPI003521F23B
MPYIQTNDSRFGEPVNLFVQDVAGSTYDTTSTATTFAAETTQPTIIFIHGWPLSHEMWENQVAYFADRGYRCVAYDRRGFGKSSKPWGGYDYDTFADDLKAVIDELNLNNVILVGFSMGGGEVARYFSRHGGASVSKAVLVSAVTPYMLQTDDNPDGVPQDTFDSMAEDIQKDRYAFLETFAKQFYGVGLLSNPVSQAHLNHDFLLASLASPKATLDCAKAFSSTDFRADMSTITVPTLIIHGDDDKTVPIESSGDKSHELLPQAEYKIYDGEPHGLFVTAKDQLNEDLLSFVQAGASSYQTTSAVTY